MEPGGGHEEKEGGDRPDDAATSRYYECVFCKQGFTTAQALGGHMNIHRRERAKNRQPANIPTVAQPGPVPEDYWRPAALSHPVSTRLPHLHYLQSNELPSSHHTYPPSASNTRHPRARFTDASARSLSFEDRYRYSGSNEEEKTPYAEEQEVDLELRLGHDP